MCFPQPCQAQGCLDPWACPSGQASKVPLGMRVLPAWEATWGSPRVPRSGRPALRCPRSAREVTWTIS